MKGEQEKSFWKETFKKWYFWVIIALHFLGTSGEGGVVMNFLSIVAIWIFVFWIIHLIKNKGIKRNKKN